MTLDALATALEKRLPGAVARNVPVAELSTYRLGGPVAVVVRVPDGAALNGVAAVLAEVGPVAPPVLVIGRGSNLLVADDGLAGVAVVLTGEFDRVDLDPNGDGVPDTGDEGDGGIVRAGGAVSLPVLARRAAAAGLTGLEFYVGIPGSVGGAVRMNAGGHGRETRDVLRCAWVLDVGAGDDAKEAPRAMNVLELGYSSSALSSTDVVTRAEFSVAADDPERCETRIAEIVRWRRENQPGGSNAGSVFRNPTGDSAGRLIDAAGCKGMRVGGAVVSEKHANFFQAESGATAADVRALVGAVQARVDAAMGVHLVPELRMVGFPDDRAPDRDVVSDRFEGGGEESPV